MNVAAAEHDIIGDERFLQLGDGENDFVFPLRFAEPCDSWNAEEIFDDVALAIRKITQLEWKQFVFEGERGAKSGAEPKKKHASAMITSQGLHRRVINDSSWSG